jgi:hypothetical protein
MRRVARRAMGGQCRIGADAIPTGEDERIGQSDLAGGEEELLADDRVTVDPFALPFPLGAHGLSSVGRLEQAILGDHMHGEGLVSDRVE